MDSDAPEQRGAMEDSPFEVIDLAAEKTARKAKNMRENVHPLHHTGSGSSEGNFSFRTPHEGGVKTAIETKSEQPWHRLAMFMKSKGYSNKEIAAKTGKNVSYVSILTRAPWFREQMEAMIEEEGRESLRAVLEGEGLNSVYTLVDVRDNPQSKGSDKISAANSLLDRLLGKSPQTVNHVDGGRSEAAQQQAKIEQDLKAVDEQLKALGVGEPEPREGVSPSLEDVASPSLSSQRNNNLTTPLDEHGN